MLLRNHNESKKKSVYEWSHEVQTHVVEESAIFSFTLLTCIWVPTLCHALVSGFLLGGQSRRCGLSFSFLFKCHIHEAFPDCPMWNCHPAFLPRTLCPPYPVILFLFPFHIRHTVTKMQALGWQFTLLGPSCAFIPVFSAFVWNTLVSFLENRLKALSKQQRNRVSKWSTATLNPLHFNSVFFFFFFINI